jgi:hypothetical protein
MSQLGRSWDEREVMDRSRTESFLHPTLQSGHEAVDLGAVVRPGHPTVPVSRLRSYEARGSARAYGHPGRHRLVWSAGDDVASCLSAIARARPLHPPSGMPDDIVLRAREAEHRFARVVRNDLSV